MVSHRRGTSGFTLIEVTFATGILFLTFVLILGALAHLALVREIGERRHLAAICLNHCLEQLQGQPGATPEAIPLTPPVDLPGDFAITVEAADAQGLSRITVTTWTTRGQIIEASAVHAFPEAVHAP